MTSTPEQETEYKNEYFTQGYSVSEYILLKELSKRTTLAQAELATLKVEKELENFRKNPRPYPKGIK